MLFIYNNNNLNRAGMTHIDVVKMIVVEELNCIIKMVYRNLNGARSLIEEYVVEYIGLII